MQETESWNQVRRDPSLWPVFKRMGRSGRLHQYTGIRKWKGVMGARYRVTCIDEGTSSATVGWLLGGPEANSSDSSCSRPSEPSNLVPGTTAGPTSFSVDRMMRLYRVVDPNWWLSFSLWNYREFKDVLNDFKKRVYCMIRRQKFKTGLNEHWHSHHWWPNVQSFTHHFISVW